MKMLLENGLIRPSGSPWASPVVLVAKTDGGVRLCVDYRRLNGITKPDPFPLPRIDELIDGLARARYLTTLELARGYHQVPVHQDSISKTAFITPKGKWEYLRMPFGLKNAPSLFQRMMNAALADMASFAAAYIDDIVVFSLNFDEHLSHLEAVLIRMGELGLTLKARKCQLARSDCQFLGHRVGRGQVRPLQAKIEAFQKYPRPKRKKEMRAFLGLANYYRRFIPGYGSMAVPLTDTTRKNAPDMVEWTSDREQAFQDIKKELSGEPVLISTDPEKLFILYTDASGIGIGAVLSQTGEDGQDQPVAFYSRRLKGAETRYTVTEQGCLAVVEAIRHFRVYLLGATFHVVTDHSSLRYLDRMRDENGRLARWAPSLQPYIFEVIHRPGKHHVNADGMSRQALPTDQAITSMEGQLQPSREKQRGMSPGDTSHPFQD